MIHIKHTASTPKTFIRKEPAAFNLSGVFPVAANSLSAYIPKQAHHFLEHTHT